MAVARLASTPQHEVLTSPHSLSQTAQSLQTHVCMHRRVLGGYAHTTPQCDLARAAPGAQQLAVCAVSVYYTLADDADTPLRGRRVIHFIDNASAMAVLVKDYSADADSARLAHTFWALACAIDVDVWFEFCYSEANIADWPSRGRIAFASDLGAERADDVALPPPGSWGVASEVLDRFERPEASEARPRKRCRRR